MQAAVFGSKIKQPHNLGTNPSTKPGSQLTEQVLSSLPTTHKGPGGATDGFQDASFAGSNEPTKTQISNLGLISSKTAAEEQDKEESHLNNYVNDEVNKMAAQSIQEHSEETM